MLKTATNQNSESQNGDMPKRRQTVNDVTLRARRAEYCIVDIPHNTAIWLFSDDTFDRLLCGTFYSSN